MLVKFAMEADPAGTYTPSMYSATEGSSPDCPTGVPTPRRNGIEVLA